MILVVDDDRMLLASLRSLLARAGYEVCVAASPDEAMAAIRAEAPRLVLMDMNYTRGTSGSEGLTLLRQVKLFRPDTPVILMTAWGSIDLAVEGMRNGAFDFITKPWDNNRLLERIATALSLNDKSGSTPSDTPRPFERKKIIGDSNALREVLAIAARVAPTGAPVLITGESGTGKELLAEALHRNSPRASKPFIKVNLGGMPGSLFESEMFGHTRGAFTGAVAERIGRFEAADGGTIFLDEIGELDSASQVKMLRVLQEQCFEPLGSSRTKRVDVRVVCATNADLPAMVAAKTFREDLFYRINLVTLHMPSLRERRSDLPALARHFAAEFSRKNPALPTAEFEQSALEYLATLKYPGNIREFKNLIERAILMSGHTMLTDDDFRLSNAAGGTAAPSDTLEGIERRRVADAIVDAGGNISRAAAALGISRAALYRKIEKYGIDK